MSFISWILDTTHRDWEVTCVRFCKAPVILLNGQVMTDGAMPVMCRRRNGRWEYRSAWRGELLEDAYQQANSM